MRDANGTGNIYYNGAGVVSIGTLTAPTGYKLAVGGKAIAEEIVIKLQANWPDYVFENSFKLTPLNQLESYVKANKHLPEVPTAAEVDANGLQLGEMNMILLKKVEELTLYIIEQDKIIQNQKAAQAKETSRIEDLERKMEELIKSINK